MSRESPRFGENRLNRILNYVSAVCIACGLARADGPNNKQFSKQANLKNLRGASVGSEGSPVDCKDRRETVERPDWPERRTRREAS